MSRTAYSSSSPRTISELLAYELDQNYCRESGVMAASGAAIDVVIGTPIALISGAPVLFDATASDGSETIVGLSLTSVNIPDGSAEDIAFITDGPARIVENRIVWPAGTTTAQITAAKAVLIAKGIKFITGQGTTN